MARPRIFISSTYFDLKHIRASLELFLDNLGFEPVLSEKGSIAYDPDTPLDESCYREVTNVDIFVLIIGGRYGTPASGQSAVQKEQFYERYDSITKREYEKAVEMDVPSYILIERDVYSEHSTYLRNKGKKDVVYAHVDSVNIFELISDIIAKSRNNPIKAFEKSSDIETWLKEQWAGLFKDILLRRNEQKQLASLTNEVRQLSELNTTLKTYLEEVVKKVSKDKAEKLIEDEDHRLAEINRIQKVFSIPMMQELLKYFGLSREEVLSFVKQAKSCEDFLRLVNKNTKRARFQLEDAILHWKNNLSLYNELNEARAILDLPPLDFE